MATRYPILLVHGIALKDFSFFKAFGKIGETLRGAGNVVFTSRIDGFGKVETNAAQLKEEILSILALTGAEKVNIIAHSKGGLDSKYMIAQLGMEGHVASLTTLCTPHGGSPIAANLLRFPKPLLRLVSFWLNLLYRIFGDKEPDAYAVCRQLARRERGEQETVAFSDTVYCQSYSATLEKSRDDFVMGIPLIFSHYFEDDASDGMVTQASAMFENYRGKCVKESVSHSEIVDFMAKKGKREKILGFYTALVGDLEKRGF